jgi:hypothetical protein
MIIFEKMILVFYWSCSFCIAQKEPKTLGEKNARRKAVTLTPLFLHATHQDTRSIVPKRKPTLSWWRLPVGNGG